MFGPLQPDLLPLYKSVRRRMKAKRWTMVRLSREAGIDRAQLTRAMQGHGSLKCQQFARVLLVLGLWEAVRDAMVRAIEEG